jgi:hypothetical protein
VDLASYTHRPVRRISVLLDAVRQTRDFHQRANLRRAATCTWNAGGDRNGFLYVRRLDQEVAAQLFLGFRIRTVRDKLLAIADPDTLGGRRRLQRGCS